MYSYVLRQNRDSIVINVFLISLLIIILIKTLNKIQVSNDSESTYDYISETMDNNNDMQNEITSKCVILNEIVTDETSSNNNTINIHDKIDNKHAELPKSEPTNLMELIHDTFKGVKITVSLVNNTEVTGEVVTLYKNIVTLKRDDGILQFIDGNSIISLY